ncbi:hypothetical protein SPI_03671 [Niveomyces insectorum RCEF 264]|uniref:Uncharacterized protein n=1 Tax=Niveomyces insectorum RCEF 264 TaxID=1081102 RepID=A0A167W9N5_9HYPO|nr:hypothetical protein SPI_03671 [Niveomyces insectorum RCEF 264]
MAHHNSFSSARSSLGSASPSVSTPSAASAAAPMATASFSVFQEGPGQALVFSPPLGTPELQTLVDLFIALDVPVAMKMEMIQRDFQAHTARTSERYKTYFVPSAATAATAATAASAFAPAPFTASPSPVFRHSFDSAFSLPTPATGASGSGGGSGSGSLYLEASPVVRLSPTEADLTLASDNLFSLPVAPFPAQFVGAFHGEQPMDFSQSITATTAAGNDYFAAVADPILFQNPTASPSVLPAWPLPSPTATPRLVPATPNLLASARRSRTAVRSEPTQQQRRRVSGNGGRSSTSSSSMQILTRSGEDVTHVSSRATRTHEERENTRLVRQRGACPDCRRKKTRCNPGHAGFTPERGSRVTPYVAPAQAGRARGEAAAAQAAQAAKAKVAGKKPVTTSDPVILAPQPPSPAPLARLAGDISGGSHDNDFSFGLFADSFDWTGISDHGRLFTAEELELNLGTSLATAALSPAAVVTDTPVLDQTPLNAVPDALASHSESPLRPARPRAPRQTEHAQEADHLAAATHASWPPSSLASVRRTVATSSSSSGPLSSPDSASSSSGLGRVLSSADGPQHSSRVVTTSYVDASVHLNRGEVDSSSSSSSGNSFGFVETADFGDGVGALFSSITDGGAEQGPLRQQTPSTADAAPSLRVGSTSPAHADAQPPRETQDTDSNGLAVGSLEGRRRGPDQLADRHGQQDTSTQQRHRLRAPQQVRTGGVGGVDGSGNERVSDAMRAAPSSSSPSPSSSSSASPMRLQTIDRGVSPVDSALHERVRAPQQPVSSSRTTDGGLGGNAESGGGSQCVSDRSKRRIASSVDVSRAAEQAASSGVLAVYAGWASLVASCLAPTLLSWISVHSTDVLVPDDLRQPDRLDERPALIACQ